MRKLLRFTYYAGAILLFLVVAVAGFTQTKAFRTYLHNRIVSTVAEELRAELEMGIPEGNLITGFRVRGLMLHESGIPVLSADRVEARYDPISILTGRVTIVEARLLNPTVLLSRAPDGEWNISRFVLPSETERKPSRLVLQIRNAELVNGRVLVVDSVKLGRARTAAPSPPATIVDYPRFQLTALNFKASLDLSPERLQAVIREVSFRSTEPSFTLSKLSGEFLLDNDRAQISHLRIETPHTQLTLDAGIDNVQLTRLSALHDLETKPIRLSLKAEHLSFSDLKTFLPSSLAFLEGAAALDVKADGTFGELHVDRCVVQTSHSMLRVDGYLRNLHAPEALSLELVCIENQLDPDELQSIVPGLRLPAIDVGGVVTYNLRFVGTPYRFAARWEGRSPAGEAVVDGVFGIDGGTFTYDATLAVRGLNLQTLLASANWQSHLNGRATVKGFGTDPRSIAAVARIEVDSSTIAGLPLHSSVAVVDVAEKALRSRLQFNVGRSRIDLSGTMQFPPDAPIRYAAEAQISGLNLAQLLKDNHYQSNLSFSARVEGSDLSFDDPQGNLHIEFAPSTFGRHTINESSVRFVFGTQPNGEKTLELTSDVADIRVNGEFRLDDFVTAVTGSVGLMTDAIGYQLTSLDSLRSLYPRRGGRKEFRPTAVLPSRPVNATFHVDAKSLFPLGVFLGERMAGNGTIEGKIERGPQTSELAFTATVKSFGYAVDSTLISLTDGEMVLRMMDLHRLAEHPRLNMTVDFTGDRLLVNNVSLTGLAWKISVAEDSSVLAFHALLDSVLTTELAGTSHAKDGFVMVSLNRVAVSAEGVRYDNIDPVRLTIGRDGLYLSNLWMRHEAEEVSASGFFNPAGISDLEISVTNVLLNNLRRFTKGRTTLDEVQGLGGIVNARIVFRGSLDHPNITLDLAAHGTRFRETVFGQVVVRASYFEQSLDLFAELRSKPDQPSLPPDVLISGRLPLDLRQKTPPEELSHRPIDLTVRSRGLRLELFDPFVAELSAVTGLMVCDMRVRGTVGNPLYEGSVAIQGARFLFTPLNLSFLLDGQLVPVGQRIVLERVTVRNVPQDRSDGTMNISGFFTLEGLRLRDFALQANGQLLVMKEAVRRAGQSLYGDLLIASGGGGIRWAGNFERSQVSGEVMIRNASLTLPPTREQLLRPTRNIVVSVIDDAGVLSGTERVHRLSGSIDQHAVLTELLAGANGSTEASLLPRLPSAASNEASLLDRLSFDLVLETQGLTQVRFIFNPFTGEELFAELKGRMSFSRAGDQVRLAGEVEVGERSYYSFFKKFQATGKLLFTGDPLNPELNIVAKYEGVYQPSTATRQAETVSATAEAGLEQKVVVTLNITGTRQEPRVAIDLEQFNAETGRLEKVTRGDVESDAIAFILTGQFRDDLTQQDRSSLLGSNLLYGLTSSVLSGPLTDFFRKEFGFISSVDVIYYGGSLQAATDVRVTGEIGDAVIRFGGRVFNDITNANVSVQIPMSSVLGSERWRNLQIYVERRVEGVESFEQRRESNGVRLVYRIAF